MTDYEESYKNYLAWLTPRELLQEYKFMFSVALSGTKMDQRRNRKQVCVLMLDAILWFGFGAILIFPYGVWCGAKWSGGYKK